MHVSIKNHPGHSRKRMIALWILQLLIAVSFCGAGLMTLAMPIAHLAGIWPWTGDIAPTLVRLLGVVDIAGGAGVLLPSLLRFKPCLAVRAAAACIALQLRDGVPCLARRMEGIAGQSGFYRD